MTAWWEGRLCALDVETTSAEPEDARIVTAAIVYVGAGQAPERLTLLVDPGVEIPEEASAIHGVTTERARAEGVPARDALMAIRAVLATAIQAGMPVCAFNARYDLTVVDRELRRHGLAPLPAPLVIDALVLDKHLDRYRKGSRRLDAACEHYRVTLDGQHDADHDAVAAARLAWRIANNGQVVRRVRNADDGRERAALRREWDRVRGNLPALHACQARWAREQAEGLAEHFAAKGEPQDVPTAWPLVPVAELAASNPP